MAKDIGEIDILNSKLKEVILNLIVPMKRWMQREREEIRDYIT